VPASTRIPTAFANTLWDRRLESGAQRELDLSPRGSAAASQADGNSGGEHLPREQRPRWAVDGLRFKSNHRSIGDGDRPYEWRGMCIVSGLRATSRRDALTGIFFVHNIAAMSDVTAA
jgi:hypothetical protein